MKKVFILIGIAALLSYKASAQTLITAKDALNHIGETVTVIDKVYNIKLINDSKAAILYLGADNQNTYLIIQIKGADMDKFIAQPEGYFIGSNVHVTGTIVKDKGKPEIIVSDPSKLKIELTDNIVRIPAPQQSF